ncbi:hypothetical protein GCM10010916_34900 [Paenibacillus abyssi]|uniref:Uncharacterized protein n=2 Tax=Paenibacillus abyssi TaxID=1340531 RepID=A0A917FZ82_9BACL|nr:hypothetical protein GCM10010916_34900 [Paenibacillus abyssi]
MLIKGIVVSMDSVSRFMQKGSAASRETSAASQQQLATMEDMANSAKSPAHLAEEMQRKLTKFSL